MSEDVARNPEEEILVRRLAVKRSVAKSISNNNAYSLAQEAFAVQAALRLCQAARDDLCEITRVPARKRSAAIRRWTKRWQVDTVGMRSWAVGLIETFEVVGPRRLARPSMRYFRRPAP